MKKNPFSSVDNIVSNLYINKKAYRDENLIDFYEDNGDAGQDWPEEFLGKSIEISHLKRLTILIFLGLAVLVGRSYYLQVQRGDYYSLLAEGNRIRQFVIPAARGIIFDRDGELLVRNIPRFSVFLTVADLPDKFDERDLVIKKLTELINVDSEDIKLLIKQQERERNIYQPISVVDNLDYDQMLKLKIAIKELAGVNLEVSRKREYLAGNNFSAIMGYVGKISQEEYNTKKNQGYLLNDIIGKNGIEYSYEDKLRGVNGIEEAEVDALGKRKKVLEVTKAAAGNNLYLTIDTKLQNEVGRIVQDVLQKKGKSRASVVIMKPRTGEILSLLSLPTYDNNLFIGGINQDEYKILLDDPDKPLFFRAIAGEYASGSTIKPVWSAAALQEGIINPRTSILSAGGIRIGQWFFPDWRAGGHGATSVRKAIADSVNTFYYYIGGGYDNFKGLGINRMVDYAKLFNIGSPTGIDLPGERGGFVPTPEWKKERKGEVWYIGDTYHIAIGQGDLLATPLQVAVWTSFFANGGKILKPRLVNKISKDGQEIDTKPVIIRKDFIDKNYVEIVKQGMRQGVTRGSSRFLSDLPIKVSGKTGTAQWNTKKDNHAWWTGFAPYDNPEIVITILVEEGGGGSKIAVPIAKEILRWWIENKN